MNTRLNGFSIVAFTLLIFGFLTLLMDLKEPAKPLTAIAAPLLLQMTPTNTPFQPILATVSPPRPTDLPVTPAVEKEQVNIFEQIRLPYDSYTLTQKTHGSAYGDAAIDLSAGKGMAILSPIYGVVAKNGKDEWGNPALVIENDRWEVTLLHGDYFPAEGDWITIGQLVGKENNLGYTVDIYGRSCKNRNCGYHTHLNVYDKQSGENADLMELLHP